MAVATVEVQGGAIVAETDLVIAGAAGDVGALRGPVGIDVDDVVAVASVDGRAHSPCADLDGVVAVAGGNGGGGAAVGGDDVVAVATVDRGGGVVVDTQGVVAAAAVKLVVTAISD